MLLSPAARRLIPAPSLQAGSAEINAISTFPGLIDKNYHSR